MPGRASDHAPPDVTDHEPALRAYLRRRIGPSEDVEDFVQDVYLRVLSAPPQEDVRSWRGFLVRIASNLLIDHHRRKNVRMAEEHVTVDDMLIRDEGADPERTLSGRQELAHVAKAIQELGPVARDAFLLVRVEGLSHKEAALRLGITPKAVSHHVERSLARLARQLGSRHD
ncbi:RNA polymerase sigma factor [Sphingomonas abietis]|uniref:RNA polymerase sigma factor n=1 Tax=Sphingomonas abietis TaxID=3012344 RepID=A0ABY7NNP2_9SPHN|nr:RNA polymerase sigma factor [Sphingomonas abietis]WBO22832.1 RNA polymerase sigma factor [Sphingomonas abietis]